MRAIARWVSRLVLATFFRRIEVIGAERACDAGPFIYAMNHPNGLIDPLFVLAFVPGRVAFMAKEPLFRMPLVRHFVRAFDCLPVYRREDGADPSNNANTLDAARRLLAGGGSIALFPEGTTHRRSELQPLKTGAARIALSARAGIDGAGATPVRILPVGLYYPEPGIFRSDAVVIIGEALDVPRVAIDAHAEPPRDVARALTARLDHALRALTVNASDAGLVTLAAIAAHLLDDALPVDDATTHGTLGRRVALMQAILTRHDALRDQAPERLRALIERLREHQRVLTRSGLDDEMPARLGLGTAAAHLGHTAAGMLGMLPLVLLGLAENVLPYRIVGRLARRAAAQHDEVLSTAKVLLGFALFPLTWVVVSVLAGVAAERAWGAPWGFAAAAVHLVVAPLAARSALWFLDRATTTAGGARVLWLTWMRRRRHAQLLAERDALVTELLALAETPRTDRRAAR